MNSTHGSRDDTVKDLLELVDRTEHLTRLVKAVEIEQPDPDGWPEESDQCVVDAACRSVREELETDDRGENSAAVTAIPSASTRRRDAHGAPAGPVRDRSARLGLRLDLGYGLGHRHAIG